MNQQILNEGIKHLLSVEPNFTRFIPDHEIDFFLRPKGFKGICEGVKGTRLLQECETLVEKCRFGKKSDLKTIKKRRERSI